MTPRWITSSATGRRMMAHNAFARLAMPVYIIVIEKISGVASVTKRSLRGNVRDRLVGVSRCIGTSHRPFEPAREQHSSAKKRPPEESRYRARQKGSQRPSVEEQAKDQGCQVDKRRRRENPCLVLLVAGHMLSPSSAGLPRLANFRA